MYYYNVYAPFYPAGLQPYYWNGYRQQLPMYRYSDSAHAYSLSYPPYPVVTPPLRDYGKQPFVIDINEAAERNRTFRTALWTGNHLQVTLMSINVGEEIGLEIHPDTDQFLRIEEGSGVVKMGPQKDQLTFEHLVEDDDAIMIPAGTWHNVINTGDEPLKLYSIYAPPHHPFGTVHETKADAMAAEQLEHA